MGADQILKEISEKIVSYSQLLNPEVNFEAHCYEVLIAIGLECIFKDYQSIKTQAINLLVQFKKSAILDISTQENLRLIKNKLGILISQVKSYRQALIDLLDDEDDCVYMSLTLLEADPSLYLEADPSLCNRNLSVEKEETINLLESYLNDYNNLLNMASYISLELHNSEELILLRLDVSRNALLVADTKLSVVNISLSLGSFIGSMFGMNLINHFESTTNGFLIVFSLTGIISVIVTFVTIMHFKKTNVIPK